MTKKEKASKAKEELTPRKVMAILATQNSQSALRALGYTASALLAAGYTASDLRAAGYTASALRALGYTASDLLALGYTASALLAAGYTASDLKEWEEIPKLDKPYSRLLDDIKAEKRIHNQSDFGPGCDPKTNLCKTPMCTAGHLVNMAGEIGYRLKEKYGWQDAAALIHYKSRPEVPPQNFGAIPQEFAMAYIEERAAEEEKAEA